MPNNYIVMSIGPIYKTLLNAKRTRELWGASYLFSWIMKQMILRLNQVGFGNEDFIVPYVNTSIHNTPNGVGLYPDMLLVKLDMGRIDKTKFESALNALKLDLTRKLYNDPTIKETSLFVNDYFRFAYREFQEEINVKPIITAGKIANQLELCNRVNSQAHINPILKLLDKANNSFLSVDGFSKPHRFPTLIHIATHQLAKLDIEEHTSLWNKTDGNDKNEEQLFVATLQQSTVFGNAFRNYHKYIAIVKADGDRIGSTIENWQGSLRDFSKKLNDFGIHATKDIKDYGGVPIYLGGDDLLFFAPVNNGASDIFSLCNALSEIFSQQFDVANPPTLSFGISISFYKYPLYSALEEADNLLYNAKKPDRNGMAWKVLQHSGQYFDERLNQSGEVFRQFKVLLSSPTLEKEHLKSVVQHFRRTETSLWQIIVNIPTETLDESGQKKRAESGKIINPRKERIEAYFANFFNEKIHRSYKGFFETLGTLVAASLPAPDADKEKVEAALKTVYALLRTVIFTKGYDATDDQFL